MTTVFLSSFFNALLSALSVYFLSGYLLRSADGQLSFILSCVFAAGAGLAVWFFSTSRLERRESKKTDERSYRQRMLKLYLCTDDEIQEIFKALFDKLHICARVCGRHMRLGSSLTVISPLSIAPMTADGLIKVLRECPYPGSYAVISAEFTPDAKKIADILGVKLIPASSLGALLDEFDLLPAIDAPMKKPRFFTRFSSFLYKTNGRRFLIYGTFLFVLSSFTFYPVYYIVFGTVFVVYGLIAAFFGKTNVTSNGEDLNELLRKYRSDQN